MRGAVRSLASVLFVVGLVGLPGAGALTLSDFEEPYAGSPESGGVVPFGVTAEEAARDWAIAYRNHPQRAFNVTILAPNGTEMFHKTGTRNLAVLPSLPAGEYRWVIGRAPGEFQVLDRGSSNLAERGWNVEDALSGGVDVFLLQPPQWRLVNITGNVSIEVFDLTTQGPREQPAGEAFRLAEKTVALVTLRGGAGTPYAIRSEVTEAPAAKDTPGSGLLAGLAAVAGAAWAGRRARS